MDKTNKDHANVIESDADVDADTDADKASKDALAVLFESMARPAPRAGGGWKGNQKSLLNLDWRKGREKIRMCARCGAQFAVRGSIACRHHGGGTRINMARAPEGRRAKRAVFKLLRAGALPAALVEHPAFRAAVTRGYRGAVVARKMAIAHMTNSAEAWAEALKEARARGLSW